MISRYIVGFVAFFPVLAGQANELIYDEAAFRDAVRRGLPVDQENRQEVYTLKHEDVAIPILEAEIKRRMEEPGAERFVLVATDLIVGNASPRAIDAVADLCSTAPARFPGLVEKLLDYAVGRKRQYDIAYDAINRYAVLQDPVTRWVEHSLSSSTEDARLAQTLLRREKVGHRIDANDILLSRLQAATVERVMRAVTRVRAEEKVRPAPPGRAP